MVLTRALDDKQQTVVRGVRLQVGAGGPFKVARVLNRVRQGVNGLDVVGGTAEEHKRDGALGGRLPFNGVRLAGSDEVMEARLGDGIARRGLVVVGLRVGRGQDGHGRKESSFEEHFDVGYRE